MASAQTEPFLLCRVQLVDDEVLTGAEDQEGARVDVFVRPTAGDGQKLERENRTPQVELKVECPLHLRLLRKAYVKAIGHALWIVNEHDQNCRKHGAEQGPDVLHTFIVTMSPRPQLNCVIALGCLGYYIDTDDARASATSLVVSSQWPLVPVQKDWFAKNAAASATAFQMQTLWAPRDRVFRTSYYDLVKGKFQWVDRLGLFETTVACLRSASDSAASSSAASSSAASSSAASSPAASSPAACTPAASSSGRKLRLQKLDLVMLGKTLPHTPVYVEFERHDGCSVAFFGTAGDVLAKAALLPTESPGFACLVQARIYYVKTSKRCAVLAVLNDQRARRMPSRMPTSSSGSSSTAPGGTARGKTSNSVARSSGAMVLPQLKLIHVEWMPDQALQNLGKVWFPETYAEMNQRATKEPEFCDAVLASLPAKVRAALLDSSQDLDKVAQCLLALATCPEIMDGDNYV